MGLSKFILVDLYGNPLNTTLPDHSFSKKLQRELYHKCWNCGCKLARTVSICIDCQMNMYLQQTSLNEFKKMEIEIQT